MGSEMCIRDRRNKAGEVSWTKHDMDVGRTFAVSYAQLQPNDRKTCLLYTSDAADERSSVDLGGRRIIKKKHNEKLEEVVLTTHHNTEQTQLQAPPTRERQMSGHGGS